MVVEKSMARAQGRQVAAEINKCKCEKMFKWDCALPPSPSLFIILHLFLSHYLTLFVGSLMGAKIEYGGVEHGIARA